MLRSLSKLTHPIFADTSYLRHFTKCYTNQARFNIKQMKQPRTNALNSTRYLRRSVIERSKSDLERNLTEKLVIKPCVTLTTGEKYNLRKCQSLLEKKKINYENLIPGEVIVFKYNNIGDVMVLGENGSIVCWGVNESVARSEIIPIILDACENPLEQSEYESEDMDYVDLETVQDLQLVTVNQNSEESFIVGDLFVINNIDPTLGLLDKAAFSSGLSRSTNLAVLENTMEDHIRKTRIITEKISKGLKLKTNGRDALKFIGKLFLIRGKLNLYSELIETPDLYWSEPQLEKIFNNVSKYLDITPRINILNTKLDYSTDECRALISLLNERNGTFLEWIIIYLIAFEVCFELYHYMERVSAEKERNTSCDM